MTFEAHDLAAANELAAVQAGYGPLYEDLATSLGSLSTAASHIEQTQDGLQKAYANVLVLREVANLLPHATGRWIENRAQGGFDLGVFEFGGEYQQYQARLVQANTLWLRLPSSIDSGPIPVRSTLPCYIIGRRYDTDETKDELQLLLLPASGIIESAPSSTGYHPPRIVTIRKEELAARNQQAERLLDEDYNNAHSDALLDHSTGRLVVRSITPGSVLLSKRGIGQPSMDRIQTKGMRYDPGKTRVLGHGIDDEVLDQFGVDTAIAHLATAFGVTEAYKSILETGRVDSSLLISREQRLAVQNDDLRTALGRMMLASGLFDETEIARHLNTTFPPI
jgi:hypothetical protein